MKNNGVHVAPEVAIVATIAPETSFVVDDAQAPKRTARRVMEMAAMLLLGDRKLIVNAAPAGGSTVTPSTSAATRADLQVLRDQHPAAIVRLL